MRGDLRVLHTPRKGSAYNLIILNYLKVAISSMCLVSDLKMNLKKNILKFNRYCTFLVKREELISSYNN